MSLPDDPAEARRELRHARLREILRARIESGTYPLGSFLPTEAELCAEFGVSRYTVREALRRLTEAGYLQRRQGSGSEVIESRPRRQFVHAMRSLESLFQYAADTTFAIRSLELATPGAAHADDLLGQHELPWLILRGLRSESEGGRPICASTVFLHADFAALGADLPHHRGAIYALLEARFGIGVADVEQQIRALPMPAEAGRDLGSGRGAWAVRVLRRYRSADGRLLLASVNHHPAERFFYAMHLRREPGQGRD